MNKLIYILIAILLGAGIVWEVASWKECLKTNPWWYCMRVLGK